MSDSERLRLDELTSAMGKAEDRITAIEVSRDLEDDYGCSMIDAALDHYQAIIMRLEGENERLRAVIRQYQIDQQPELEATDE